MTRLNQYEYSALPLLDTLNLLTVDDLKNLLNLLPVKNIPTRKGDLVTLVKQYLQGEQLKKLWSQLDHLQQTAVSETLYTYGAFKPAQFAAKYGGLPTFDTEGKNKWGYSSSIPTLLRLFIYSDARYSNYATIIPAELEQELRQFVPKPEATTLKSQNELPESYSYEQKDYELADDDEGITIVTRKSVYQMPTKQPKVHTSVVEIPLIQCHTEKAATQDIQTLLRLTSQGKLSVSNKTFLPSKATTKAITNVLREGDFFNWQDPEEAFANDIGPIKSLAWPLMLQASKLTELQGGKLALTKSGQKALTSSPADTLKLIWSRWLKSKLTDEFNRINAIKGQKGKGKRSMTAVSERRSVIVEVLRQCPVNEWVAFDDFSRFMQALNYNFEVIRDPWHLYIEDPNYGNLAHGGYHDWHILQGRYILCFLFEYAATLGLIDVAYISPQDVQSDYSKLWGADDLDYLSRYDGLIYFRLNPLGAYCLGLTATYEQSQAEGGVKLTVLPNLQVTTAEKLSTDQALLLETYAEKLSDQQWRLSQEKMLAAVESGHKLAELKTFLTKGDDQPLPETVEGLIAKVERQAQSLTLKGPAILIECADAKIANAVAQHKHTQKLCMLAGEHHLVVKSGAEEAFKKALRKLGYGMTCD
ncbi:helicase-associated domain-containing protein [Endozoicomonas sp. SM1973]|uniref:Helicase-associated domain-containing protein n=1 Tax=Spartinivicinus marinus TaxID=2994442 RepID=A0A853I1M4_9GAMM|nr:helicase-associated domain-containing protein [Spartinivicinus marinus]MCX4026804.1 helicase-associated domain-containing protein [Spartinivicinus marinus]NYZ64638.1 helicase-associated domain-containing protein [Spartinivicinus marinus]